MIDSAVIYVVLITASLPIRISVPSIKSFDSINWSKKATSLATAPPCQHIRSEVRTSRAMTQAATDQTRFTTPAKEILVDSAILHDFRSWVVFRSCESDFLEHTQEKPYLSWVSDGTSGFRSPPKKSSYENLAKIMAIGPKFSGSVRMGLEDFSSLGSAF